MKTEEYAKVDLETYDNLKIQERVYKESIEQCQAENNLLRKRKTIITFETFSRGFCEYIQNVELRSDEQIVQAAFDELKDQHKKENDKLMNRSFWQRVLNTKP